LLLDGGDLAVSGWVEMTVFSIGEESGRAWREYPILRDETAKDGAPGWMTLDTGRMDAVGTRLVVGAFASGTRGGRVALP
jgi:hypothetical protein